MSSEIRIMLPKYFDLVRCLSLLLAISMCYAERICELQGTCHRCEQGRLSFYTCHSDSDCFPAEQCTKQRFCCPKATTSLGYQQAEYQKEYIATRLGKRTEEGPLCPDGSHWSRMCNVSADCVFTDEVCAEGKCCPSCRQRRAKALTEMLSNHRETSDKGEPTLLFSRDEVGVIAVKGFYIPQCEWEDGNGTYYRALQCRHGTNECYCADKFGRQLQPNDAAIEAGKVDCGDTRKRKAFLVPAINSNKTVVNPTPNKSGEGGRVIAGDEEGIRRHEGAFQCADPRREFKFCGGSCPISCATIRVPRCQLDQCVRGCFCRLPYVLLDGADPLVSKCVLPAECPMLHFPNELNSWSGEIFPTLMGQFRTQQQDFPSLSLHRPPPLATLATELPCIDPLKNYLSCGSYCPVSCGQLNVRPASCLVHDCVAGCYCRVPYVLLEASPHAPCVLPQHCPAALSTATPIKQSTQPTTPLSQILSTHQRQTVPTSTPLSSTTAAVSSLNLAATAATTTTTTITITTAVAEQRCTEPNKEFRSCASACPLGCDQLHHELVHCSPCVSGCFCRNGYIFENGTDWRNSKCVPAAQCFLVRAEPKQKSGSQGGKGESDVVSLAADRCPQNPVDKNGRTCDSDFECGFQQKCCPFHNRLLPNETTEPLHKCTCIDPHAVWMECGTFCPDYCGRARAEQANCPRICRPGCFCAKGYVKENKDGGSLCVPTESCQKSHSFANSTTEVALAATAESSTSSSFAPTALDSVDRGEEIEEKEEEGVESLNPLTDLLARGISGAGNHIVCGEAVARAVLYGKRGSLIGQVLVRREKVGNGAVGENRRLRLTGVLDLGGIFNHTLSVHQLNDITTGGCKSVGPPLVLTVLEEDENGFVTSRALADLPLSSTTTGLTPLNSTSEDSAVQISILWTDPITTGTNPLIGHTVVLRGRERKIAEANETSKVGNNLSSRPILSCAILGIAPPTSC